MVARARGRVGGPVRADPGGPDVPAATPYPCMRVREIEIHHADLGAGYTADQWPPGSPRSWSTAW